MASKVVVTKNKLNAIGDALREKRNEASQYTLDEMPEAIRGISKGGGTWYSGPIVPEKDGITYTVRIDLEKIDAGADQSTWGEWIDDAVNLQELPPGGGENGVDALMGYYPCALDPSTGEEIAKLQPNNYRKTLEGEDINADYVMVYYPERGMRIWYEDATHLCVSITTSNDKPGYVYPLLWGDRVAGYYINAYQTVIQNGRIYSKRTDNQLPNTMSYYNIISYANDLNSDYCKDVSVFAWTYLACCALIKYKGKQISQGLGVGIRQKMYPGGMDTHGLNNVTDKGLKLFGLERIVGCYYATYLGGQIGSNNYRRTVSNGTFYYKDGENDWNNVRRHGYAEVIKVSSGTGFLTRPSSDIVPYSQSIPMQTFMTFFQSKDVSYESDINKSFGFGASNSLDTGDALLGGSGNELFYCFRMNPSWSGEDMYNGRFMFFKPRS